MTKKFTNLHCIYCLGYFENLTKDHVFPESWFPDSTPKGMEKWVVPACLKCNNKLGKIEEATYNKLALSVTKDEIAASGISEKIARKYNPSTAKDECNKNRKIANIRKVIPDLYQADKIPTNAFMKNCGLKENERDKRIAVFAPFDLLNPFAEKIFRGLEFKFRNKLIDSNIRKIEKIYLPIGIENIASTEIKQLNNILNANGIKVDNGPGFIVRHVVDKYGSSLYHVTIWGKIEILGSVSNKNIVLN